VIVPRGRENGGHDPKIPATSRLFVDMSTTSVTRGPHARRASRADERQVVDPQARE